VDIRIRSVKRAGLRGIKVDVRVRKGKESPPRHWSDIEKIIRKSAFSNTVKANPLRFSGLSSRPKPSPRRKAPDGPSPRGRSRRRARRCHRKLVSCRSPGVGRVFCSPLNVGSGWVRTSHGVLPVPPPAVARSSKTPRFIRPGRNRARDAHRGGHPVHLGRSVPPLPRDQLFPGRLRRRKPRF